jgi:hypothetical protein
VDVEVASIPALRRFETTAVRSAVEVCVTHMCGAGGAGGIRTPDIRLAKAALSQLSYGPTSFPPRVVTSGDAGGPSWIRTRDLSLIRTAL